MDVWKIGVEISLQNSISAGLGVIAKEMIGLKGKAEDVHKALTSWNLALNAAAAIMVGKQLIGGMTALADKGKELLDQQDKLQRAGMSYTDTLKVQADYYDKMAKLVPTASASDYLRTYNELRSVWGADAAGSKTPWSLMVEALIGNATGTDAAGEGMKLNRALEMTGKNISNPELVTKLAGAMVQDIIGSAGKLNAGTFQAMAKTGGASWAAASPEFLAGPMAVVASDMGGDRAGTAMTSAYMFLNGANTLSKQQYETLKRLNLIDPSKVTTDQGGRINVGPGGIRGSDKYGSANNFDLFKWEQEFLNPAMSHASKDDANVVNSLIAKIGRNRSVIRMLTMFNDPGFLEQINKDQTLWKQSKSVEDAYGSFINNNPKGVDQAFNEQLKSMMEALGSPAAKATIPVMKAMTEMFQSVGKFANNHSDAISNVGTAIGKFTSLQWQVISTVLGGINDVIASNSDRLRAILGPTQAGFRATFDIIEQAGSMILKAANTAGSALKAIVDAISSFVNMLKSLAGGLPGSIQGVTPGDRTHGAGNAPNWQAPGPGGRGAYHPTSWAPPANGNQPVVIHTAVNVDGRKLAHAVSQGMARNGSIPSSSSTFDGRAMFSPTDANYV